MTPRKGPERYFTQLEAAKEAGIAPKTLYTWLRNGDVQPSLQVTPKKFLYTEADIEELKLLKRKNVSLHNSKAAHGRWAKKKLLPGEVSQ